MRLLSLFIFFLSFVGFFDVVVGAIVGFIDGDYQLGGALFP